MPMALWAARAAPCLGSYWQSGPPAQNGCFLWQINFQIDNIETGNWGDAQWIVAGVLLSGMTMDQWYHRIFSLSFFKTVTKKGWCYKDDDCSSWFFLVNIGFCKKSPRNGVRHPSCDSSSSGLVVNFRPDDLQQWYRLRSQDCAWSDPDTPEDPLW